MIYVVGGKGFVGSAIVRLLEDKDVPHVCITRSNVRDHCGTSCEVLIDANGNSSKVMAQRDPASDFDISVRSVVERLEAIDAGTYVYLSSGDVYPDQSQPALTGEDTLIDVNGLTRYGLHKFLAEQLIRGVHQRWLIVRMSGFVGRGLKKNAIYDLLHDAPVWIAPESELQFISTDSAAGLVWEMIEKRLSHQVINLGGRGVVSIGDVHRQVGSASQFQREAPRIRYELCLEKLARLLKCDVPESRAEVEQYIEHVRVSNS